MQTKVIAHKFCQENPSEYLHENLCFLDTVLMYMQKEILFYMIIQTAVLYAYINLLLPSFTPGSKFPSL